MDTQVQNKDDLIRDLKDRLLTHGTSYFPDNKRKPAQRLTAIYLEALKAHDPSYVFSDDHRVWQKGEATKQALHKAQHELMQFTSANCMASAAIFELLAELHDLLTQPVYSFDGVRYNPWRF